MIKEFQEINENRGIPRHVLQNIEYDLSGGGARAVQLTSLQREAINNQDFWCKDNDNKNLIIQGATSSGKTMVAELLALQCVYETHKHVVYLVPLKALVSEKVQQFKKDVVDPNSPISINVFASSADYQDHDTELAEGQYDIAVVVYEKFFAMLAEQKNNKFLEKCSLIIVDEIQLLGSQDRGAKLEYSLTKVINNFKNEIRIVGLTTIDCDTNYICKWLDASVIKNSHRPIGLVERIVSLNGLYWERSINRDEDVSEDNNDKSQQNYTPGKIEIEGADGLKNQRNDIKREALLRALLSKIYSEDPSKKIIVFTSSRRRCESVARAIAKSNIFERLPVNVHLETELDKTDDEKERQLFRNELLPYGIAYHSAALPMSLREMIESEFKKNDGGIRLIVATETITIGMNLPADVMILYDNQVHRGSDGPVDIKPQEYKNYIGRAGRLGITDKQGESYLFVNTDNEIRSYWNQYVNCKVEAISSSLRKKEPRECAPYFLNLLCKGRDDVFNEKTIDNLAGLTLNSAEAQCTGGAFDVDAAQIIKYFKKVQLITDKVIERSELDDEDDTVAYKLTNFGEELAPYALSLETCVRIKKYFRDAGDDNVGGLPISYTGQDLRNGKYLLDILYNVCKMQEVSRFSHPRLPEPSNPNNRMTYQEIEKSILLYLKNYKDKFGDDAFWHNSEINNIFFEAEEEIETEQLNAALRAILLIHWIKGELPSDIRSNLSIKSRDYDLFTVGDLARVGESCSYIVEAISKCFFKKTEREDGISLERAFYSLAIKLKYGLENRSLIQIAKKHVYGLSRSTIIRMDDAAKNAGFDNINLFIRSKNDAVYTHLTKAQQKDLIQQISERYDQRSVENLITKLVEDEIIDYTVQPAFSGLAHPRSLREWNESLCEVVGSLSGLRIKANHKQDEPNCIKISWNDDESCINAVLLFDDININEEILADIREKYKMQSEKIMCIYNKDPEEVIAFDNACFIDADYFCKVIVEFLALSGGVDGKELFEYLSCLDGFVSDKGTDSLQKNITDRLELAVPMINSDTRSPYDMYIEKYDYTDNGEISCVNAHARIHKILRPHNMGPYIIKEIIFPETSDEFLYYDELSQKKSDQYIEDVNDGDLKNEVQIITGGNLPSEDVEKIIQQSRRRVAQLMPGVNKKRYLFQSLLFLSEGYRKLNEARITTSLQSQQIVKIYNPDIYFKDYEHPSLNNVDKTFNGLKATLLFSMEMKDGSTMDIKDKLYNNTNEIITIGKMICDALIECHEKGILHRDIKPGNILYEKRGDYNAYYLSDFGSASTIENNKTEGVGTINYMAPEVERTEKSDIYSLSKSLIYLYTGSTIPDTEVNDKDLMDVLCIGSSPNPDERYDSVRLFRQALENRGGS